MTPTDYARRGLRRLTSPLRPLPSLLIAGAMRAGTTSLFKSLSAHSQVVGPTHKEIHFFDTFHERGPNWYRAFFPLTRRSVGLEASPSYLNCEVAADRAVDLLPEARIFVVVRDPVERAWSNFRLRRRYGAELREFADAVAAEFEAGPAAFTEFTSPAEIPYISAGLYAEQLRPWFRAFGPERVLVLDAHDLFADPASHLDQIQRFAQLPPEPLPYRRTNEAPAEPMPDGLAHSLRSYFREPDEDLAELLGRRLSWMD